METESRRFTEIVLYDGEIYKLSDEREGVIGEE